MCNGRGSLMLKLYNWLHLNKNDRCHDITNDLLRKGRLYRTIFLCTLYPFFVLSFYLSKDYSNVNFSLAELSIFVIILFVAPFIIVKIDQNDFRSDSTVIGGLLLVVLLSLSAVDAIFGTYLFAVTNEGGNYIPGLIWGMRQITPFISNLMPKIPYVFAVPAACASIYFFIAARKNTRKGIAKEKFEKSNQDIS